MPEPDRSFDRLAVHFDRFAELAGGPLNAYLESVLPDQGGRAIDLGCGTGRHVADLAQALHGIRGLCAPGGRVVLIDNVADHPSVPRQWFVTQAIATLAG